jgi:Tripartite tricarboxylate transporter family receptor
VRDLAGKWDGLFLAYLIRKNYWLRSDGHRLRASEVCPRAARATPDGYTIEMGHMGTHAASVALYPDYMRDQIVNVVQQVQAGQIKAYAVGTPERSPALPDVPTSQQAGLPEFQAQAWNALFARKTRPSPSSTRSATRWTRPSMTSRPANGCWSLGACCRARTSAASRHSPLWSGAYRRREIDRWTPIIKAAGPTN